MIVAVAGFVGAARGSMAVGGSGSNGGRGVVSGFELIELFMLPTNCHQPDIA